MLTTFINCSEKSVKVAPNTIVITLELALEDNDDEIIRLVESNPDSNSTSSPPKTNKAGLHCKNSELIDSDKKRDEPMFDEVLDDVDLQHLPLAQRTSVANLIYQHRAAIAIGDELEHIKNVKAHIDVQQHPPICTPQYRIPHSTKQTIDTHVQKMLSQGVIKPCASPWSSPVLLIKKRDTNEARFVTDYRQVNLCIKRDVFPIPRIETRP